jgi:CheY-like chemotaxis protein
MAELLLQSPLTPAQRNDVVTIRHSAEQQLAVLSQLFDFARLGSSEEPIQHSPFALRACLREVSDKLATDTAERGLIWEMEVGDEVPDALVGDAGCLRQVLFHLLSNAVKFTERGSVRLVISNEDTHDAKARLRLTVHDSGVGIPEDRRSSIFEAFEQADGSNTRRHGGIGLGLTLASQLVARMGGTIEMQSEVGKGTTFSCHLPFELAESSARSAESGEVLVGLPVLLVDGGGAERTGIEGSLERWGVQARVVPGPDAAIAEAQLARSGGRPFVCVVIDERGGGFDAFAAAGRVADGLAGTCPIVVFASQSRDGDAERCAQLGVGGLLSVPSSDEDLRELLLYRLAHPDTELVTEGVLQARRRQHRVLLVEDNVVNRKVATRLLEHSGYQISVAVNGVEALQKIAADTYDIVLMDIQMPEMDGLEATRHLRASEQGTGRHLPVIALTAHTLGSDLDSAREAGMDDLVAKPIRADVLLECMRKYLKTASPRPRHIEVLAPPLEEVLDWREALERMDGDEAVLHELLQLFVQDSPNMLKRIEDARHGDDLHALERAAHGLKGASATISAFAVAQLALRVEMLAREGHEAEAQAATAHLEHEMQRLIAALKALDTRGRRAA